MDPSARHALIVEDELITSMAMRAMLEPHGFGSFAFASTAEQALEQARLRRPDLVTMDVNLLAGDGIAAGRALHAEFGVLPTLYVTAEVEVARVEAARLGGGAVVPKPFTAAELALALWEIAPLQPKA